ncbi:MAG: hypothetical protein MR408_07935 [Spirochaetia bacterium]|nr:hypothetical protein [Spirochaetia bacterium]
MNAGDKQNILDFIDFYVVLGIVHQKTLCKYLGISARTIQRWRKNGTADKRKGSERKIPRKLKPEERRRIYQELCSAFIPTLSFRNRLLLSLLIPITRKLKVQII